MHVAAPFRSLADEAYTLVRHASCASKFAQSAQSFMPGTAAVEEMPAMAALPTALFLLAQTASAAPADPSYGAAAPAPAKPAITPAKTAEQQCAQQQADPNSKDIVVCAIRPQGYRIDPDVLAAKRMKKKGDPGPPKNPHETYADHSCATVGPMGCRGGAGFDVAGAAMAAANMIDKAVKGENVGQTLVTDPTQSEYKLYQEAKREREAKEAEKAAKAIADQVKAEKAAKAAQAGTAQAPAQSLPAAPQE
jgi:hypothetical protein